MGTAEDLHAEFERLKAEKAAKDREFAALCVKEAAQDRKIAELCAEEAALRAEGAALRAQLREAWRAHLNRSVAGAMAEAAAYRRSLATGRCVP